MADEELIEGARKVLRKEKVPHKFCPYCGARNEPDAEECASCRKDISWIRVPEPVPPSELYHDKPRKLPEQQPVFSKLAIGILVLVIILVVALVIFLVLRSNKQDGEGAFLVFTVASMGLCLTGSLLSCNTRSLSFRAFLCCTRRRGSPG